MSISKAHRQGYQWYFRSALHFGHLIRKVELTHAPVKRTMGSWTPQRPVRRLDEAPASLLASLCVQLGRLLWGGSFARIARPSSLMLTALCFTFKRKWKWAQTLS